MSETNQVTRRRHVLLSIGATVGLVLAASGLIKSSKLSTGSIPDGAIARVGEQLILEERFLELISDLEADKRTPLDASDRDFALNRLIDEELLILRGIELGLHRTSPEARKSIASVLISQIASEAEASPPTEAELRQLYESDSDYFTSSPRYRLRWWRIAGADPEVEENAMRAFKLLSTELPPGEMVQIPGLQTVDMLPDELLPPAKLADYMGPSLTQLATDLEPGEFSAPRMVNGSFHIVHLLAREEGTQAPFEQVRSMVEAEYTRRAGDLALRQYLAWLRDRTEISVPARADK